MSSLFTRRKLLNLGPLVLLPLCAACRPPKCAPRQTLVFYDQSASSVVDSQTAARFASTLSEIPDSALSCTGDELHGFLVHGATTAKGERIDLIDTLVPDTASGSTMQKATKKTRFQMAQDSLAREARTALLGLRTAHVQPAVKAHTDMLGVLSVASDELHGDSAMIYVFGDMRESMPAPRRNFDVHPPSQADAEQWADADAELFKPLHIDRTRFRRAQIRVMMGNLANKPSANEVRSYWERLLRNAGFDPRNIRYN
jgi:hypothetical protein